MMRCNITSGPVKPYFRMGIARFPRGCATVWKRRWMRSMPKAISDPLAFLGTHRKSAIRM